MVKENMNFIYCIKFISGRSRVRLGFERPAHFKILRPSLELLEFLSSRIVWVDGPHAPGRKCRYFRIVIVA